MANKQLKMLCIGKATQDVFLKSDEFDPHQEGKVAYTHLPLGAKLEVDDVVFETGGNATNASVTFARQGLHAQYMWVLGHEPASQIILNTLDAENVDTSLVCIDESYRASYSTVMLSTSGERTILNYHGTTLKADGGPLNLSSIGQADWLYVSSLGSMELLERIITTASEHGVKVAFNPAGSELAHPEKVKSLLEDVAVLLVNKEEMQILVEGTTTEELARHGVNYCPVVVVSDGPKGVVATDGKTVVRGGLYEDVPVIDRTGAGDAFGSGFVSMHAQGKSLQDSVVFASANSTSVVQQIGAKSGILHANAELHDMPLQVMQF